MQKIDISFIKKIEKTNNLLCPLYQKLIKTFQKASSVKIIIMASNATGKKRARTVKQTALEDAQALAQAALENAHAAAKEAQVAAKEDLVKKISIEAIATATEDVKWDAISAHVKKRFSMRVFPADPVKRKAQEIGLLKTMLQEPVENAIRAAIDEWYAMHKKAMRRSEAAEEERWQKAMDAAVKTANDTLYGQ